MSHPEPGTVGTQSTEAAASMEVASASAASAASLPLGDDFDITPQRLREALGRFATGVTIVTCQDAAGERVGLTANSFNALSLDPPLVLWSLRRESSQMAAFAGARHFGINVLAQRHLALSRRFASRREDKFEEGDWSAGAGGVPVLTGCSAVFECETELRQDAGDHVLFIGRVLVLTQAPVAPLVYQAGHYHALGETL